MKLERYKVLLEWEPEDRVWVTYVPDLDWLSTYGETREEALERTEEAVLGYLEAAAKEGLQRPIPRRSPEVVELEVAVS
ncbi:MAG: type II toxin-antitoxin system HicB family antitoxin [Bacillota bacterium]